MSDINEKLRKLTELMRRPFPAPDYVIYEGEVMSVRDWLNLMLPQVPGSDTAAPPGNASGSPADAGDE